MLNPTAFLSYGVHPGLKQPQKARIRLQFGNTDNKPVEGPTDAEYLALAGKTTRQRQGYSISGRVHFRLETDQPIPGLDTGTLQMTCGYHPAGYDHFVGQTQQFDATLNKYVTTFSCAASCD